MSSPPPGLGPATRALDHVVPSPPGLLTSAVFSADGRAPGHPGRAAAGRHLRRCRPWCGTPSTWTRSANPGPGRGPTSTTGSSAEPRRRAARVALGRRRRPGVDRRRPAAARGTRSARRSGSPRRRVRTRRHPRHRRRSQPGGPRRPGDGRRAAGDAAARRRAHRHRVQPRRRVLAVANSDGRTQLFDVETALELGPPLAALVLSINDVTFSADDGRLATGGTDRTGALWRLDGGRTIAAAVSSHEAAVTELAYTSDGRYLVSSGSDGRLLIRDLDEGTTRTIEVGGEVLTAAVDPTDRWVAAAGTTGVVKLFDVRTGEPGPTLDLGEAWIYQVAFDPTSGNLAVGREDAETAWRASGTPWCGTQQSGREVGPRIPLEGRLRARRGMEPRRRAARGRRRQQPPAPLRSGGDHAEIGEPIESIDAPFLAAAFSPDGTRLATGSRRGWSSSGRSTTHRAGGAGLEGPHRAGRRGRLQP